MIRHRVCEGALLLVIVAVGWFAWSFTGYVRDSQGEPTNVLLAEWGRDHHLGAVVATAENVYYDHFDTTPVGGTPTETVQVGGAPAPGPSTAPRGTEPARRHLNPPPTVLSPAANSLPLEGVWQPVGSTVDGIPAVYATRVRPDAVHTSVLASVMWIDTSLTHAMFVPGYIEPGGPAPSAGALPKQYWSQVLANFNGAFRLQDSQGGYFYHGTTVSPLQPGAASAVIYQDGSIRIGQWGRDVSMTPSVVAVRQNLNLIVDGGRSQVTSSYQWGATTHGESLAWRSAVGQRPDGSIVYVGSPGLSAASLADTLVRAGVVRAMVLDMNNWWVAGFYFSHAGDGTPLCAKLDPNIQESCNRFLNRYKRDSFQFLAAP